MILSHDNKELFVQRFVNVLIKIESTRRREIKEQALQLILLYRGRTVRSSHRNLFLKIFQYLQENTCVGVYF